MAPDLIVTATRSLQVMTSVVEITRSASASLLNPEFNDFLFASIGEDRNGMLLSVFRS